MQKVLLLLLFVAGASTVQAQSLRDLLYGGKLKSDSNTVVRKTDDLSTKIDTGQKKTVAVAAVKDTAAAASDSVKKAPQLAISTNAVTTAEDSAVATVETAENANAEVPAAVPAKSNTRLWKDYTDSLVTTLKPDFDRANKIKKGTYHVLVAYEIDTTGQVAITNVGVTPGNEMVQALTRQYLDSTPLQLAPTLDSTGKPRKTRRSGSFTITKD
jgi:hypothetical protein